MKALFPIMFLTALVAARACAADTGDIQAVYWDAGIFGARLMNCRGERSLKLFGPLYERAMETHGLVAISLQARLGIRF